MLSVLKLIAAVAIAAMLTPTVFAQQRQTGGPARLESKASEQAKAAFRDALF